MEGNSRSAVQADAKSATKESPSVQADANSATKESLPVSHIAPGQHGWFREFASATMLRMLFHDHMT